MRLAAFDDTHVAVEPPMGIETYYYYYKKHRSVILLAAAESTLKFTYINVGAPGHCNDAFVYGRSTLYDILQGLVYAQTYLRTSNTRIQAPLIADSAFPLSKNLMKPYIERMNMPPNQSVFNFRLSHCRSTVERAFGHLKNRFRSIHKKMEYDIENTKTTIKAACILHNICIDAEDVIEIDWNTEERIYKKPNCSIQTTGAPAVREALTEYFLQNPL